MDQQRKIDDIIIKDKIATLKKEKELLQKERQELLENLDLFSGKFEKVTKDYNILDQKHRQLLEDFQSKCKELTSTQEAGDLLKKNQWELETALRNKTDLITKLEKGLSTSEQNFMIEKARNAENELALLRTKEEVKTAAFSI